MKLAVAQHECRARKLGRDEPIAKPELVAQRNGGGLLHEQRVGSRIDDELADALGHDDAARPLLAFEDDDRAFAFLQLEGGREPGNSAADDGDVDGFDQSAVGSR